MYAAIDLGDPVKERAAFFGALEQLGGLGAAEHVEANPASPYPPKKDIDFDDTKGGGWRYRAKTDGTFLILATPPSSSKARGKTFRADGTNEEKKIFQAIKDDFLKYSASQTEARSAKRAATASKTADIFTAVVKGIGEAAPGVISKVAAASEAAAAPPEPPPEEKKGWGALEYGLLAGGVVVTGVVGYLIYRSFSAPAAVAQKSE